ncbi:MAG: hypothetical protein WKF76_09530 [Nocardioidaceae bacterium]
MKANVLFFDKKPAAEQPWTQKLWVYDFRTNIHFTLKQNPLRRARPRRLRRVATCPARTAPSGSESDRVAVVHVRRACRARQGEPRHHLAARRVARRRRQPAGTGGHRPQRSSRT